MMVGGGKWSMSNYWECMKLDPPIKDGKNDGSRVICCDENSAKGTESYRRYEAYRKAHEIRQFEIGLFWQRATYYWAFILAAFTAHFALLGLLFSKEKDFSIPELYNLPGLSVFALTITAFFCYFFSLCWVLMNKGSKFWQKNWEEHIDELEREFSGDLYKTILNTKNNNDFNVLPFIPKAYDYSVSKITMLTSIVLMVVSFFMLSFYLTIFGVRMIKIDIDFKRCEAFNLTTGIIIFLMILTISIIVCYLSLGNKKDKTNVFANKWINLYDER